MLVKESLQGFLLDWIQGARKKRVFQSFRLDRWVELPILQPPLLPLLVPCLRWNSSGEIQ